MPLKLLTGRAGAGKTGAVYDALEEAAGRGREALLLLPTRPDVERARAALSGRLPVGPRIEQFDRYLDDLWLLNGDGRVLVSDLQRDLFMRDLLTQSPPPSLAEAAAFPGTRRLLGRLAQYRAETGSPVARAEGLAGWAKEAAEIDGFLGRYLRRLQERGLVERGEAHRRASAFVPRGALVAAHLFTSFSGSQEAFLAAASRAGSDVLVTLTWEELFPATAALDQVVARLSSEGTLVEGGAAGSHLASPELARMEALLFARPEPQPSLGHVTLLVADGEDAEAEGIARRVRAWIGEGVRAERIAVVFRGPERHLAALRSALGRAGLDADFDVAVPVTATPMGAALSSLRAFLLEGGGRRALAAFLSSPYSGADPSLAAALDAEWRRRRVADDREMLRDLRRRCPVASGTVSLAAQAAAAPLAGPTARGWGEFLDALLSNAAAAGRMRDEDVSVHRSVVRAVEEVASSDVPLEPKALFAAIAVLRAAPGRIERPGRIQVTSAQRARSRRFDAVLLGGLTRGEFPSRQDPEGDRGLAGSLEAATGRTPGLAEERLLFYLVATGARQRLALSRQQTDADGTPIPPSVFWDEFLDLYRDPLSDDEPDGLPPIERVSAAGIGAGLGRRAARRAESALTQEAALAVLAERTTISAGEVEQYLKCPRSWFFGRRLRPEGLDREIDAMEAGTLAHDALREFYEEWPRVSGKRRVDAGDTAKARLLMSRLVEKQVRARNPETVAEEHQLRQAMSRLESFVCSEADFLPGFEPELLEWSFGEKDGLEVDGVVVTGRVDRVDRGEAGLVVVDYKSGDATPVAKFVDRGLVQVCLYAELARRRLKDQPVGALYRSLKACDARGAYVAGTVGGRLTGTDALTQEEFDEVLADALERTSAALSGMRSGRIPAEPVSEESCKYCAFKALCPRKGATR